MHAFIALNFSAASSHAGRPPSPRQPSQMRLLKWQLKRVIRDGMSRYRHKDALRIEDTLHNRLQKLLAKHHPVITVKLHRWRQWTRLHGVSWGGPFTALVYLDTNCFCGSPVVAAAGDQANTIPVALQAEAIS